MTTFTQFVPSPVAVFQFSPTLDNQSCQLFVTWNPMGLRWYINLYGQDGSLVTCLPLIGSPDGLTLTSLAWGNGMAVATTELPHGFMPGSQIELTLSSNAPSAYNGVFLCMITGANTFTFPLAANPGDTSQLGLVVYNVNLVAGYFNDSTLVFRSSSQNFEVTP